MTLLDFFPDDFLIIVDESHMTIPQIRGMYAGDRSRKQTLVDYGFRLPSALDNRPLNFEEFESHIDRMMFVSATPSDYEKEHELLRTEQIIRPTGLLDPEVQVRPVEGQIDDLIGEVNKEVENHHKVLITTLTKRMAEDLTDYMKEVGIRVKYLHSDIDTLERAQIIRDMRLDVFDVLVGINLLSEGLDIPEITLVAILDADKEGFLRSATSLIQTIGRAARNAEGHVIMYADTITDSMREALDETNRRREIQMKYNEEHGITPQTIKKAVRDLISISKVIAKEEVRFEKDPESMTKKELEKLIGDIQKKMQKMRQLADEKLSITLALSLHASNQEKRKALMPVANSYDIHDVVDACKYYFAQTGRRVTFEYSLVGGVNDTAEDAAELSALVHGMNCHINLIPVNPIKQRDYVQSNKGVIEAFKNRLEKNGINVTIRREMGSDIDGACGQLRKSYMEKGYDQQ